MRALTAFAPKAAYFFGEGARPWSMARVPDYSLGAKCPKGELQVDRRYDVSINPRTTPFGPYSLDLIPSPKWTGLLPKNTYANRAELRDALDRLGIVDNEKISILHFLDQGNIYRILSFPVPDEVAITFGWVLADTL